MKKNIVVLVSLLTAAALIQGCAKMAGKNQGKATPLASAGIKSAPSTAPGSPDAADLVTQVATYYITNAIANADAYQALLDQDGGCTMESDFANAIGAANLASSTTVYCQAHNSAQVNCTAAQSDASRIVADVKQLQTLCNTAPGGMGNSATANDLLTAAESYRLDLGLPNIQ